MFIDDSHVTIREKFTKRSTIILAVVVIIVIVIVGVLAGVLTANKERDKCDRRIAAAKREAGKPTEIPAKTTPTASTTQTPTTSPRTPKPWEKIRLPNNVHPIHYNMLIRTDLKKLSFTGTSTIEIKVTSPTRLILFHINQMKIDRVGVKDSSGKTRAVTDQFQSEKNQFYVLNMTDELAVGRYDLDVDFSANMSTKELNGFYKSSYKDENGQTR